MTGHVTFTVRIPREWLLTSNQRLHWRSKAERTRNIRVVAKARARFRGSFDRAQCVVYVAWPDNRRRDVHNVMPTIKACIDGIVDAGLLPDDSDKHLIGPDLRVHDMRCAAGVVEFAFNFHPPSEGDAL